MTMGAEKRRTEEARPPRLPRTPLRAPPTRPHARSVGAETEDGEGGASMDLPLPPPAMSGREDGVSAGKLLRSMEMRWLIDAAEALEGFNWHFGGNSILRAVWEE